MADKKLTIKLTDEQRALIKEATGHSISELTIDLSTAGALSEADLGKISAGGTPWTWPLKQY